MSFAPGTIKKVLERDKYQCYICGKNTNLHIHHIVPRRLGGSDDIENLVALCSGCHMSVEAGDTANAVLKCIQRAIKQALIRIRKAKEDREKRLSVGKYKCGWCGVYRDDVDSMLSHLRKMHGDYVQLRYHTDGVEV